MVADGAFSLGGKGEPADRPECWSAAATIFPVARV